MAYVITCGDEGVQINEGTRLGVLGSGVKLEGTKEVFALLKKVFGEICLAANEENAWIKQEFDLSNWEQVDATYQQQAQAVAEKNGLLYTGILPFTDPQPLEHGIKGHMVRPRGVHIANKVALTLGGGEQKYHLGHYLISADWVHLAKPELVKSFINQQIEFYQKLAGRELPIEFDLTGELGEEVATKNQAMLESVGIKVS